MFKLFKEKKPNITFFTEVIGLKESSPIVLSKHSFPDWYKNIKIKNTSDFSTSTIKKCPGFIDFTKYGYVVNMWCDFYLRIYNENGQKKYEWKTPDESFRFETHSNEQFTDFIPEHAKNKTIMILKAICPWNVITDKGYSLYQFPMYYHYNDLFEVLPGVIHSDVYHNINQQMCIYKEGEFIIKKGTPLAMYVPFKRTDYNLTMKMEDNELKNKRLIEKRNIKSRFFDRFTNYKKDINFKEFTNE
jgi:hypothetical protein